MTMLRGRRGRGRLAGIACALLVAGTASAAYADRPIKVFLPFPPGGAVDFVSRLVCAEATELLGKPVVLDHWVPDAATRKRILVDNAATLFGFKEES